MGLLGYLFQHLCFDFFPYSTMLPINGKVSHKTWIGVLISYLFLISTFMAFFFFGKELVLREEPNLIITENQLTLESPLELDFSRKDLRLSFAIFEYDRIVSVDETYIRISAEHKSYYNNGSDSVFQIVTKSFEVEKCASEPQEVDYADGNSEIEHKELQSKDYCLSERVKEVKSSQRDWKGNGIGIEESNSSHLFIKGFFGASNFSTISIKFSKCKNITGESLVCKSPEEIDRKINSIYIGGKILNSFLTPRDFERPVKQNFMWFYSKPVANIKKQSSLLFQKHILLSDRGLLLKEEESQQFYSFSSTKETVRSEEADEEELFFSYGFYFENIEKVFHRKYIKIQDVFAQVGGLLKTNLIIIAFLLKPLITKYFRQESMKALLKVRARRSKEGRTKIKKESIFCSKLGGDSLTNSPMTKDFNYLRAYRYLENKIDIKNLIHLMDVTNKLIQILFDEHQEVLFRLSCKREFKERVRNSGDPATYPVTSKDKRGCFTEHNVALALSALASKKPSEITPIDRYLLAFFKDDSTRFEEDKRVFELGSKSFNDDISFEMSSSKIKNDPRFQAEPAAKPGKALSLAERNK